MAVSNNYCHKVQSNTSNKPAQLQNYKDNIANPIGMIPKEHEIKYNDYQAQQLGRWDQQRQRSVSSKQEDKIKSLYLQPEPISINQNNLYYSNFEPYPLKQPNQGYKSNQNNNIINNNQYNANKVFSQNSQKRPQELYDQLDIALNQQTYHSQKVEIRFKLFDLFMNEIKNPNHMVQLQNSKPPSKQQEEKEEDSMNCTQASFMKTQNSKCIQCLQDIYEKKINLVCWHNYHTECLSQIVGLQIQLSDVRNLPKCLCGIKIKQKTIYQLQNGRKLIEVLMKKQLDTIFKQHHNYFKKCPKCEFRFLLDKRLGKTCYCDNCGSEFKIQ
ncbi:unnamed protein product (macronuclear) [Paramecium tetraurelia]|uniref:RING-type domain-containing protein n=1 Tax=Paramecium tetraurelia TaxID=5888 RepID=A0CA63_PARTE|nr:uncharacterized protein GSPATT00036460001 [Paramecium tetraurelia]CAK67680.1 unnamed protein product [Paramecium tetraurelia]|eukprot:XP_001435077.1 hypothetical protein (macronuclear) [Paramecium tetraurelia strain d4-2]